jgi:hypothetical protein
MDNQLVCWKCGVSIEEIPLPLGRESECKNCRAQLHVCKLCEFYNPDKAEQCEEPIADYVRDKERANFCDYFKPKPGAYAPAGKTGTAGSISDLNALFGLEQDKESSELTEAEKAKATLEDLFKDRDPPD